MSAVFIAATIARDEVAAGARLLDQLDAEARRHGWARPSWERLVDATVDVDDPMGCPLGQTFGHFGDAPLFADIPAGPGTMRDVELRAVVLGFWATATPGEEDDSDDAGNSAWLNQRWREEIQLRLVRMPATAKWVLAA